MSDHQPSGPIALALAGGGTKGAFAAGAIQYLAEEQGVVADIITGASAGSVIGVVLAQARGRDETVRRAAELRHDLLAMTGRDLVFGRQPWLAALDGTPLGSLVERALGERMRPPVPEEGGEAPLPQRAPLSRRQVAGMVLRSAHRLPKARARWRERHDAVLTLEPLDRALRHGSTTGIEAIDPSLVTRPGLELRLAVTALDAGELRFVTGQGRITAADATTELSGPAGGPVDLVDAVVASSSVPAIFPPHRLAGEHYIDGGVLQNVPVAPALALGAGHVLAVLSVPLGRPPRATAERSLSMGEVYLRSTVDISFMQRQRNDLQVPRPEGTVVEVIDPLIDVVGPFEVSPGLMRIDMDYGWLRAADVVGNLEGDDRRAAEAATAALVIRRTRAWHLEESVWRGERPFSAVEGDLRSLKAKAAEALFCRQKLGAPTPIGIARAGERAEAHQGPPPPAMVAAGLVDDTDSSVGQGEEDT